MALDIHTYEDGRIGELLFQIDDKTYNQLHPAFESFRKRTGQFVDPYGDLVLTPNFATLIFALEDASIKTELLPLLKTCARSGTTIIFAGD